MISSELYNIIFIIIYNVLLSCTYRLILIAEKDTVYKTFPTPLINRLEKHFVLTETILLEWQENVLMKLKEWVETFSNVPASSYRYCVSGFSKTNDL